jgi:hypothetical protein
MFRSFALATACTLTLMTGCVASTSDTIDDVGDDQEQDVTGKTKHYYKPIIGDVHTAHGCGVIDPNDPHPDCSFGFVLNYTKQYADLTAKISHEVNPGKKTITIKVDTWSYNTVHSLIAVHPQDEVLGMMGTKAGTKYAVTVIDRKGAKLWTGSLMAPYHL